MRQELQLNKAIVIPILPCTGHSFQCIIQWFRFIYCLVGFYTHPWVLFLHSQENRRHTEQLTVAHKRWYVGGQISYLLIDYWDLRVTELDHWGMAPYPH